MISLKDFLESNRRNNMIIQMSLQEIDMEELAIAMLGYNDEEQEAILRNMSRRAAEMLKEETDSLQEHKPPEHRIMKKAMQYYIDVWEPMLSRSMLERAKKEYLKHQELIIDMIIEGADALWARENPLVVREKRNSFLVS